MTATTTPTAEELREQIAGHEQTIADAEREIGRLTLDGKPTTAAAKRAEQARGQITQARAALEELDRRETDAEEAQRIAQASDRRRAEYEFVAELAARAEKMLEAQAAAKAAEDAYMELQRDPRFRRFKQMLNGMRLDTVSCDLDADVTTRIPTFPRPAKGRERHYVDPGSRFTVDEARELRALAEQRAREEADGRGQAFSGVMATASRESLERRRRLREENKAAQQREREERVRAAQEAEQRRRAAERRRDGKAVEQDEEPAAA